MADGVARSPSRLCSRDGKICCYGDALSTIFLAYLLFLCLASYFSFFVFLFFLIFFSASRYVLSSSCPFVCAAVICYSQQVRILQYVFFLLVSFVPYPILKLFFFLFVQHFFFSHLLFLGWRFFVVLSSYPVRQHLICRALILVYSVWFFSLTVCDHRICISLG